MKHLFCPWRSIYARSADKKKQAHTTGNNCVFCNIINNDNDQKELVITRTDKVIVMMNRYPYNAGHLLIVPLAHKAQLYQLDSSTRSALIDLTSHATKVLQKALGAHGHNIGMNLEKAAGAGIPEHVHMHVLPRWEGDTNFLPTLTETKQISFDLKEMYNKIKVIF